MISIDYLLTALIVILIPGTGVIYTISIGLTQGKRASMIAALGCTFGIIPSLLACVLGLSALFHSSTLLFEIVRYIGVFYLIYLAYLTYKNAGSLKFETQQRKTKAVKIALHGCLINILNPKLSIFFLAFLPQFVTATNAPTYQLLTLGVVFMLLTFIVFIVYGLLANMFSGVLKSEKSAANTQYFFSMSFALLAIKLAITDR